jgi:hypothetical protein
MPNVFMPRPIDSLVILGLGQSCQSWPSLMANRPHFNAQIWTINAGALAFRHDVVFDMHTEEYCHRQEDGRLALILARRKQFETHDKPVVMPKASPLYPTSQGFPLRLVVEALRSDYFANGMCYMLALAMLCGVKHLSLIGADFTLERDEPDKEFRRFVEDGRACVEYWLGRLVERGCEVVVTDKSPVLMANQRANRMIYGYHVPLPEAFDVDQ